MHAGKLDDNKILAAIGMVSNINIMFPVTLTFGTSRALSTFVSQSYGSGNFKNCAELSNKHMILITICFVPLTFLLWNTSYILIILGFNREAADIAGSYTRCLIWGFYMDCMF
jgi:Na+-driven multidrug efflux pump